MSYYNIIHNASVMIESFESTPWLAMTRHRKQCEPLRLLPLNLGPTVPICHTFVQPF